VNEATFTVSDWYISNMLPFVCGNGFHFVKIGLIDNSIDMSISSNVNIGSVFDAFTFDASGSIKGLFVNT
jgi:hypothetical protein